MPDTKGRDNLMHTARRVLQSSTRRQPNDEDVREAVENLAGFFKVLREWVSAERQAEEDTRGEKGGK